MPVPTPPPSFRTPYPAYDPIGIKNRKLVKITEIKILFIGSKPCAAKKNADWNFSSFSGSQSHDIWRLIIRLRRNRHFFYERKDRSNDNNLRKCSLLTQLNLVSKALQLVSWASKTDRQIDDTKATHLVYSHCSPWQPKWLQPGALISKHFLVCVMYLSPILRWCSEENF